VLGVASLVALCGCPIVSVVTGIVALVLGIGSRRAIAESQGTLTGEGVALGGLITGAIGGGLGLLATVAAIVYVILVAAGISSGAIPFPSPTPGR
jgi:hypothetical protein